MAELRIAVLIDAENISHAVAGPLLAELAKFGRTTVKRAYGDWTSELLRGWRERLNRHAIAPEQTFAYTTGKNSSDSALIIDAMDLLHSGDVDAFAIVSSDSDFTRLVTRLRESGKTVYAAGAQNTPRALQEACDRFIRVDLLEPAPDEKGPTGEGQEDPGGAPEVPNLQSLLVRSINVASDDDGWVGLSRLGSYLRTASPSFDQRVHGYPKLLDLIQAQPYLVTEGAGASLRVRVK